MTSEGKDDNNPGIVRWKDVPADPADIPTGVMGTRRESNAISEVADMSEYRPVFEHLLPLVAQDAIIDPYSGKTELTGEVDGRKFEVKTPHLRRGKHAFVGLVTITNPDGTTFSSVIRNDTADAEEYMTRVKENPAIKEYVPKLYGIVDEWVVMERLYGLELEELGWKLQHEPAFLERYTDSVLRSIQSTAHAGLLLNDVAFIDGHNVMVDPETVDIRLIEQRNLDPLPYRTPQELIAKQLFRELELAAHRTPEALSTTYPLRLIQQAFKDIDPRNLYIRGLMIKPTHKNYKDAYYVMNWENLSDEEYKKRLSDPVLSENYIPYYGSGFSEAFSEELIAAVQSGDAEAFKNLIANKSFKTTIEDTNDPRSQPVVLSDDQI